MSKLEVRKRKHAPSRHFELFGLPLWAWVPFVSDVIQYGGPHEEWQCVENESYQDFISFYSGTMIDVNLRLRDELQCRRNEWLIFTTRTLEIFIMVSIWKLTSKLSLGRQTGIASVYLHNTHRDVLNRNICHFIGGYFVAIPGIFCTISLSFNPISDRDVQA